MPRTERQIAEYMAYYARAPKEERKWALENLSSVEKKSKNEILAICEKYNGNVELRKVAVPEDLTERVRTKAREGMSTSDIVKNYGLSASTVNRIKREMRENGEDIPKDIGGRRATEKYKRLHSEEVELNEQQAEQFVDALESSKAKQRQPEAYPGQINDDEPEPIVEEDVKVVIPGEHEEPKKPVPLAKDLSDFADNGRNLLFGEQEETKPESGTASACTQPGLWFAIRDSLSEFLSGTFGAGTELTGESVEPDTERLVIRFKTADGKAMRCTLRAEGKHGK